MSSRSDLTIWHWVVLLLSSSLLPWSSIGCSGSASGTRNADVGAMNNIVEEAAAEVGAVNVRDPSLVAMASILGSLDHCKCHHFYR